MKALLLANHYRADHAAQLEPYRPLNPAASSWNTALFAAMAELDIELHIAQFWPIRRAASFTEGRVTHHYLPRLPQVDNVTSRFKRWRAAALVRQIRPHLVHGIGSEHGYAWAAVGHGVPSVITIHGYLKVINTLAGHESLLKRLFLVREEARALREADAVIAINEFMRAKFVDAGCEPSRTTIVPNALNPVFLESRAEPAQRSIDIIMVGTLHPLKNQNVALQLFDRLARVHGLRPQVRIVGGATVESQAYADALEASRREFGLDNVAFVGKKTPAELRTLYGDSRYLLHISAFEADPTVVAEALACGVLPVVNPVAGLAHRVQDGSNGWHLPIVDVDAAADRLAGLIRDEAARRSLAAAGRELVVAERHPASVARATVAAYERVVEWTKRGLRPAFN